MLNEIISNIPADPTRAELLSAVDEGTGVGTPEDFGQLLTELLHAGLGVDFYNEAYALLVKGVAKVNDMCEEDMFGW